MNPLLKTSLFILALVLLIQCEKDEPNVTILSNNFLNALIELGVDTDGDGEINYAEAVTIRSLNTRVSLY